jgi:glycine hydroxymethyltransferase
MHTIAAIAVALGLALRSEFRAYASQVLANAQALAAALRADGARLVTGGTDNHMMVVDTVASFALDGRTAEEVLDRIAITTNKQVIPDDPRPPLRPSGIRLGTPAATTRGMREDDLRRLGTWIVAALRAPEDPRRLERLRHEVETHCARFPVPGLDAPTTASRVSA